MNIDNINPNFFSEFSNKRNTSGALSSGIAYDFVVPDGYHYASFQITPMGTTFWVDDGKTAVLPTVAITDGSAPEMNPAMRKVTPGQTLSVVTSTANAVIQVCYWD